jgi:hypothetical protein
MKKILFLLFVIILPFYGANNLFGNVTKENIAPISENNITANNKLKFSDNYQKIFLLEETDNDLDEDFQYNSNNSFKNNSFKNNFLNNPNYFLKKWLNSNLRIFTANYNNNSTIFSHFSGFSNPIFISIQVLRI